jgi:hypothetical protein
MRFCILKLRPSTKPSATKGQYLPVWLLSVWFSNFFGKNPPPSFAPNFKTVSNLIRVDAYLCVLPAPPFNLWPVSSLKIVYVIINDRLRAGNEFL